MWIIITVTTCITNIKCFIFQLTHSIIYENRLIVKNKLTYKSRSNMFRFTQEPSSGSYDQCLAKITSLVQLYLSVQTLSVLWQHIPTWCACTQCKEVLLYTVNHTHAHQVTICCHNTDNVCTDKYSWTRLVILAKHWLKLPDDGSCMNRNMLERLL